MPSFLLLIVQLVQFAIIGLVIVTLVLGIRCMLKYLREHKA